MSATKLRLLKSTIRSHKRRFSSHLTLLALAVSLVGFMAGITRAQAVKGTLLGTITDTAGAAAPGATITITETRTNISSTTTANQSGNYVFSNIQDGLYRVEATLSGFKKVIQDSVEVKVNTTVRVDLALEVGQLTETVTVAAETALLQTDRADTGRIIESRQVAELPLGFNRNFQGLLITVPGATRPTRPHSEFFNPQDSLESKVNGQSRLSNNFQIEGVNNNHKTGLLTVLIPAADAIESVSISTSNFDAELGSAGGAVSSVTIKSGTNDVRGSVFFFGNNENTRAKEYFSGNKAQTRYRQFGFAVGGPIVKDKLFYFGDYQYTSDKLGKVNRHIIPIPDWQNGDFRNAPTRIYDPATGNPDGTGRQQISCNGVLNVICPNRISPIARRILSFIPAPNIAGAALGQNNFVVNTVRERETHSFDVKINYQLNDSNSLSYRFSYQRPELLDPGSYGVYGGPANGGFAGSGLQNVISSAVNYTRTFNPRLILEARVGVSWYENTALTQAVGLKTSEEIGIRGVNVNDSSDGLTLIEIGGFSNPVVGFSASLPWERGETTTNISGIVSKLFGNHTLKMGGELRKNRDFLLQVQDNGGTRGRFRYGGAQAGLPTDSASLNGQANAFAAFLLDRPNSVGRDLTVIEEPGTKHWGFFSFVHDKWQATQKLTLDLGLRHEYYDPHVGIVSKGGLSNYDITNNTLRIAGFGDVPENVGVESYFWNFAPRLGAAYRFNDKTVLRAGFGTTIIPFPDNRYAFNFPVKQNNQFNPANQFAAAGSMAAGLPAPQTFSVPDNGIIPATTPILVNQGFFYVPPDLKEAKIHSWNVAFQRALFWGLTAEAAYVGNVGRGVIADFNLNAGLVPGQDNAGRPFFQRFGKTASVNTWYPTDTRYNSLQVKVDRRFSNGLLINTSYTLGRAFDFSDDNGGISTPADPSLSDGRAGFDRTHNLSASFVWDVPLARNSQGLAKWVFNGWQVSGIFAAQSGTPIDFQTSAATLRAPGNTQRPNLSGDPQVLGNIGPGQRYFDTSVFSTPAPNTFGNFVRNSSINGPSYVNFDGSLFKRFRFSERFSGELRADALNVTNSPHFNNPNSTLGNATFGQVTSAFGERLVRFGLRIIF
ncbi:MAG: TonB-dependent receptor [Pyrinomonadaceae bacterium]|nr:TonB-dependent receptor [Pyrinomonadaceae bacterium]